MTQKLCRKCKVGVMQETLYTDVLTITGVKTTVPNLKQMECSNCGATIETPEQMDYNCELVKEYAWGSYTTKNF